jgi:hypothetical protein
MIKVILKEKKKKKGKEINVQFNFFFFLNETGPIAPPPPVKWRTWVKTHSKFVG